MLSFRHIIILTTVLFCLDVSAATVKQEPDATRKLIEENHQKVIMNNWISKNIPYYPNLVGKTDPKSKHTNRNLKNPLLAYMSTKNKDYQFKANWKISDSDNIKVPVSNKNKSLSSVAVYNQKNPITSKSVAMTSIYNEVERSNRNIDLVLVRKSLHRMELIKNNKVFKHYHVALGKNPVGKKEYRSDNMELIKNNKVFKHYHVALGKNPVGKKEYRSDNRTPEGRYTLDYKKPYSQYHLAVHISYPNNEDLKQARKNKVDPGGLIFIHGQPNEIGRENDDGDDGNINFNKFIQPSNWTNGCIALLNSDMHEFYNIVQEGTPIIILP